MLLFLCYYAFPSGMQKYYPMTISHRLASEWSGSPNNVEWYLINRSSRTRPLDYQNHWKPAYSIHVPVKHT